MGAWKSEPAAGLGRIHVFQKENMSIRGLFVGLAAKAARPGFEGLRPGVIAGAGDDVGARG